VESEDRTVSFSVNNLLEGSTKRRAVLIVLAGPRLLGKSFKVDFSGMIIGRSLDSDIWLDDESVSRHHAKLEIEAGLVRLTDLGSRNGTFCNGERVEVRSLSEGDRIQVGNETVLKFTYQDVLDEKLTSSLYDSATKDALTGTFNKKFLLEALEKEFAFCTRHSLPLSLLMLDVDHFKRVNDTFGHPAGDFVLMQLSAAVRDTIRTEDVFARYWGEEFALLLRDCPPQRASGVAERLRRRIEHMSMMFKQEKLNVTVSIGVATAKDGNIEEAMGLIKAADDFLYQAKKSGRNKVVMASEIPHAPTRVAKP
jgi:two-component system cell cycle response regulator